MRAGKLEQLDLLRGACALMVAFHHIEFSFIGRPLGIFRHAALFVDFFFVLSGYIMFHSYRQLSGSRELKRFMLLRFFRIYPLHLLMLVGFLAYETLQYGLVHLRGLPTASPPFETNNAFALALNIALLNGMGFYPLSFNVPSWSISVEFWTYLAFAAVLTGLNRRRAQIPLAFLALSLGSLVILFTHPDAGLTHDYLLFFLRCLYGFFLGASLRVVLAPRSEENLDPDSWWGTAFQCGAVAMALSLLSFADREHAWLELCLPPAFAVIIASFVRWQQSQLVRVMSRRPLFWLGKVSYSIYMVHMLVLLVLQAFVRIALHAPVQNHIIQVGPVMGVALLVAYFLITFLLASLTYRFIEEPGRRYGRRLITAPSDLVAESRIEARGSVREVQ